MQYLRPCSEATSHWGTPSANWQRHASQAHRKPPARLLYQRWICFRREETGINLTLSRILLLCFLSEMCNCDQRHSGYGVSPQEDAVAVGETARCEQEGCWFAARSRMSYA